MSWVKLSTSILTDPDIGALTDAAFRAYIRALAYCGEHLTDGAVSQKATRTLFIGDDVAAELVTEGLWLVTDDGYEVRNYLNHQQSRRQVEATREADRERKRLAAERRSAKDSVRNPDGVRADSAGFPTVDKKRREEKRSEEKRESVPAVETAEDVPLIGWRRSLIEKHGEELVAAATALSELMAEHVADRGYATSPHTKAWVVGMVDCIRLRAGGDPDRVRRAIDVLFTKQGINHDGFWTDQIRSPAKLSAKWDDFAASCRSHSERHRGASATHRRTMDRLAEMAADDQAAPNAWEALNATTQLALEAPR